MATATKTLERRTVNADVDPLPTVISDEDEDRAEAYERRHRERMSAQFSKLKDEAKALFGMVDGRPGVTSPAEWGKLLDRAGDHIGNGRFIVRCLGAERYLDAEMVAVLITLRQNLIAEIDRPSTKDIMLIDAAIVATTTCCVSSDGSGIRRWCLRESCLAVSR